MKPGNSKQQRSSSPSSPRHPTPLLHLSWPSLPLLALICLALPCLACSVAPAPRNSTNSTTASPTPAPHHSISLPPSYHTADLSIPVFRTAFFRQPHITFAFPSSFRVCCLALDCETHVTGDCCLSLLHKSCRPPPPPRGSLLLRLCRLTPSCRGI